MDSNKWKSVAIRKEIVEIAREIGKETERPISNVFAFAVKKLAEELDLKLNEPEEKDID
tara:strand:- start:2093 stop:2269 length:177 start_codon:yes stop_codon:yes gene_type:complete